MRHTLVRTFGLSLTRTLVVEATLGASRSMSNCRKARVGRADATACPMGSGDEADEHDGHIVGTVTHVGWLPPVVCSSAVAGTASHKERADTLLKQMTMDKDESIASI